MNKILRNSIIAAMVLGTVGTSSFYNYTYAKGPCAIEEGEGAQADGRDAVAIGAYSKADKWGAIAIGGSAKAMESDSVAVGSVSKAEGIESIAFGYSTKAIGYQSVAFGAYSIAKESLEFSVGVYKNEVPNVVSDICRRITHVADGTGDHDAVTLSQAKALVNGEIDDGNTTSSVTGAKIKAELDKKVDKSALAGYAKSSELATKANTSDLDAYAKTSDLNAYAKSTELTTKANTNADNITVSDWATKLGTGEVATGNANLVTGGKVFDAIKDKADKSELSDYAKATDLTTLKTQVTDITNGTTKIDVTNIDLANNNTFKTLQNTVNGKANTNADNITVSDWATKLGTGEVATGNVNLVTGGKVFDALSAYAKTIDLATKADKDAGNIEVLAWKKRLGLVDAQATEDTASNISTDLAKIKNGFKISDGTNSSSIVWGSTAPVMTFKGTNGIKATVNNTEITFKMDWDDKNAPKFHVYNKKEMRRRARSVDSTIGEEVGNGLSFNHLNMVFGEGLKATEETGPNNEKYIYVKSTVTPSGSNPILDGPTLENLKVSDVTTKSLTTGKVTAESVVTKEVKVGDKTYISDKGLDANGKKIANVLKGEADTDAVNVGQLKERDVKIDKLDKAVIGVGTAVGKLGQAVSKVQAESREGDAMGAAMAALKPLDFDPFKRSQIMAGVGSYRGKQAVAMGLAHYANEDTLLHAGLSYAGSSNLMANAGISLRFGNAADHRAKLLRDALMPQYAGGPISSVYMMQTEMVSLKKENLSLKDKVNRLEKENQDANSLIEKANNRITELERQMKEILINLKK